MNINEESALQAKELFRQLGAGVSGKGVSLIGTAILLFTAGTIFAQFERAFDRIWRFTPPEDLGWIATFKSLLIERLTAFLLMIGVAVLVVATFVAATALQSFEHFVAEYFAVPADVWTTLQVIVTVALNTLAFGMLYHTMPRARVKWKEAFRGGLIVAIVWEIGRRVLTAFLIGGRYQIYGVVGALIAIQLWAYYAVTVILLGAEYVRVTCKHCSGEAAAEMNRRRFWQLMSKMVARNPNAAPVSRLTQSPDLAPRPPQPAKKP
jgi:membrane protein